MNVTLLILFISLLIVLVVIETVVISLQRLRIQRLVSRIREITTPNTASIGNVLFKYSGVIIVETTPSDHLGGYRENIEGIVVFYYTDSATFNLLQKLREL